MSEQPWIEQMAEYVGQAFDHDAADVRRSTDQEVVDQTLAYIDDHGLELPEPSRQDISWSQPVCLSRYHDLYPGREPLRLNLPEVEWDPCCFCRTPTNIYVRLDPSTVPFPLRD